MTRDRSIARAVEHFTSGGLQADLSRRIAIPTESQNPERRQMLTAYLTGEMQPELHALGFTSRIVEERGWPFLIAERIEDPGLPTVFGYGHGDVIRGLDDGWAAGLSPWRLTERGDRWYGRGVVDNKGHLTIILAAISSVLYTLCHLGFN